MAVYANTTTARDFTLLVVTAAGCSPATGDNMKIADIPANERQRLRSLKASGLLDVAPTERFDRLTRLAKRVFDVPVALISLVDTRRLWLTSCDGIYPDSQEAPRDTSFCAHTILTPDPLIVADTCRDSRFNQNPLVLGAPHIRFYAGCPVRMPDGMNIGAFCLVDHQPRHFPSGEIAILKDFAAIVEDEFAALSAASIDELTGLQNRRGFMELGEYALVAAQRHEDPISMVFIDLDKFKLINDCWGHSAGDQALRTMSRLLRATFKESDIIGRIGGDEFCVLLSGADITATRHMMSQLERAVLMLNQQGNNPWQLAFSWGVQSLDVGSRLSLPDLMNASDSQMYAMKQNRGR